MESAEETYNSIEDVLNNIPDNYKILEETIDIEVQKEYFDSSRNIKIDLENDDILALIDQINNIDISIDIQKIALLKLALIDSVEAFRAIEKYNEKPRIELKAWSVLSLQQSRMVIQCSLLDEQQVFISTGLGGKNEKLRYFIIFPYKIVDTISLIQQKTLRSELQFFIDRYEGIVEELEIYNEFATAMVLLPLKASIPDIVKMVLSECNHIGDYLTENVLITNMKKFDHKEILSLLEDYER